MNVTMQNTRQEICNFLDKISSSPQLTRSELDQLWKELNRLQIADQVEIDELNFKDESNPLDESVTIHNRGGVTADLSGWQIQAGSPEQNYVFPEGTLLPALEKLTINTPAGQGEHNFNASQPIWNNRGDLATLTNDSGQTVSSLAYGSSAHPHMLISQINYDGQEFRTEGDEYVEIYNTSLHTVDLSGWRLESLRSECSFVFAEGTLLAPESSARIFTHKTALGENEFSFDSPTAIWNNNGGGCRLLDYLDREVSQYHY